jgi:hypothetical protein
MKAIFCRCGHEQNAHARGFGQCTRCTCTLARLHRGPGVELLQELEPAKWRPSTAPLLLVRCGACGTEYETRTWLRDLATRKRCMVCAEEHRASTKRGPRNPPKDIPSADAFAERPHGTRLRYIAGCHCDDCREANTAYERMRGKLRREGKGDFLVDAHRVRTHLNRLSAAGIGYKAVADIAGVSKTSLMNIRSGSKTRLRTSTAQRVLAVTREAVGPASLVDAGPTWKLIEKLLKQGFTKGALALRLGRKVPALQMRRDKITAKTQQRVVRMYREIMVPGTKASR